MDKKWWRAALAALMLPGSGFCHYALVLAGHARGSQVRIPFAGPPIVPPDYGMRYAEGVIDAPVRPVMLVTRGIGSSVLRVRFNCPPEIALGTVTR